MTLMSPLLKGVMKNMFEESENSKYFFIIIYTSLLLKNLF